MVRHESPRVDGELAIPGERGEGSHEIFSIPIVAEDGSLVGTMHHHMVGGPDGVVGVRRAAAVLLPLAAAEDGSRTLAAPACRPEKNCRSGARTANFVTGSGCLERRSR
jgi:hypothetical protein